MFGKKTAEITRLNQCSWPKVENKIPIDVEEYVQKLKPQLMDVVLHWLEGKRFHEIMMLGFWICKKGFVSLPVGTMYGISHLCLVDF